MTRNQDIDTLLRSRDAANHRVPPIRHGPAPIFNASSPPIRRRHYQVNLGRQPSPAQAAGSAAADGRPAGLPWSEECWPQPPRPLLSCRLCQAGTRHLPVGPPFLQA